MYSQVSPWRSLKTRVTVFTLAVFALGIWSLSLFINRSLQADMVRLLGDQQFSVVKTVAGEVNSNLLQRLQALQAVAEMDARLMGNPAALQASLERRPVLQVMFNGGVWAAGLDGTAIADVPLSAKRIGINYLEMDFIATSLKEGKSVIGRPVMGKQLKAPVFAMTVPVRDSQGKVLGVIVGVTNLGKPNFLDALTQSTYGKTGGYALLAPQHQLIVTASDATRIMQPIPPPGFNQMLDRFMQGYEGHGLTVSSRGDEQIVAAKGVPAAGWLLALSVPTAEALAPLRDQQQRLLWATLALTLLTGALTWLVLRRQLAPVVETALAMAALADSTHIPQPLPSTHPGEIGQLVAGFNRILQTWTQRQSELQASEHRYRSLLENISSGVVVHRPDTSISLSNPMAASLLGLTQDQMMGKTALDPEWCFLREDETPMPLEDYPVNRVLPSGSPLQNYVLGVRHSGRAEPTWLISNAFPMRDAQDQIFQVVVTFTNITKRKRAEMALQHSRVMLERTENLAHLASFEWDVDTNTVTWSPEMYRIFGRDSALGTPNLEQQAELYTPASTQALFDAVSRALSDGTPYTLELMAVRPDGAQRLCLAKGFPERDASGRVVRVAGLVQDITERKQAEQYERFRSHTMELLATNQPLEDLLMAIVRGVEQLHPAMLCSILLLDSDGRHLGRGVAPSLPDFYNDAINGLEIGLGVGSCGTAAFTGERVVVTDIAIHPDWAPYKDLAARAGLGACWSQPIRDAMGQVLGTFAIYHHTAHTPLPADIDLIEQIAHLASIAIERKQALAKLQLAAGVFTHALEGIMITMADGTIIDVNEAFTVITGYDRVEVVGKNPRMLSSGRHDSHFYADLWTALLEVGHWSGEVWNRRKNGEVFAEMLTISAVKNTHGHTQQYVALFSDITAIKEHQSQLEHIAHFDALTNLPNRVLLADRLQQAMSQAARRHQQLAVAYLDLDGFKSINDRHGHEAGDQVLITLAHRMKEALRVGDTMARLGGDEFVAVLIDLEDASTSLPLLQRLLAAAALPVQLGDLSLQVSASLGVTFYPQAQDIDADQLLRQADQAMYQAKVAGKNRFCVFDAAQDSTIRDHHESLERIRHALARREFVLHYQPKVNMQSGKVIGAEALIRWQHPERGLLAPATFLPVIEDHPLAVEVGEWVIEATLQQMTQWQAAGFDLSVSVNISARQLQQGDFVERLQAILAKHPQVNPASLELEVLETSALNDMDQVSQVIDNCAQMGVKFALDDFGTGYSSLTYLKRLRVALLKIDQSFVRDMLDDPDDLAILQGVIGLAAAFKREVIAEGVETVAHGTALLRLGCELAQGYGIARPMPPEQLPAWAASWQPDAQWCALPWLGGVDQS